MRRFPQVLALILAGCVRGSSQQLSVPEDDETIVFPEFDTELPNVVGAKRIPYELDGVTLRALMVAANDYIPPGVQHRECWQTQEAQQYRVIRRGDILFVEIGVNPSYCKDRGVPLDNGLRYAIHIDGRILRRLATGEPDGSRFTSPDAGVEKSYPISEELVGSTQLGAPSFIPPQWRKDGGGSTSPQPQSYPSKAPDALSGCARAPGPLSTPAENDLSIIFPVSTGQGLVTVGKRGMTYQLDGEVLRALRIVEQDLFPSGGSEQPCWARPEAHTYRFTRQGNIIFVFVEEDLTYCHRQAPAMDSGAKYAISVDGRILRRVVGSEPDQGVWRLKTRDGGTMIVITAPGVVPGPNALETPDSGIVKIVTEPVDMPGVVIFERTEDAGEAQEAEPGVIPGLTMLPGDAGVQWEYRDGGLMTVPQALSLPPRGGRDGGGPR